MPRDAFVLKIQRELGQELCHPKYARKVSGLLRNRPLVTKVESCVALAPVGGTISYPGQLNCTQ